MFEDWGDGAGQIWGHVTGLRAPTFLQITGDSTKDWGGPARGFMTWRLEPDGSGTRLRMEQEQFGSVTERGRASLESGWKQLFGECLKKFVETGSA